MYRSISALGSAALDQLLLTVPNATGASSATPPTVDDIAAKLCDRCTFVTAWEVTRLLRSVTTRATARASTEYRLGTVGVKQPGEVRTGKND